MHLYYLIVLQHVIYLGPSNTDPNPNFNQVDRQVYLVSLQASQIHHVVAAFRYQWHQLQCFLYTQAHTITLSWWYVFNAITVTSAVSSSLFLIYCLKMLILGQITLSVLTSWIHSCAPSSEGSLLPLRGRMAWKQFIGVIAPLATLK